MRNENLILGVTTIGDLLLENRVTQSTYGMIKNIKLNIPDYQRPYKWTARNAIQLLDDIKDAQNENKGIYRLGTLILHQEIIDGETIYNIVDGQQRLITFSLLLYVLFEEIDNNGIDKLSFINKTVFADRHTKNNIPKNLQAFKRRIIKSTSGDLEREQNKYNNQKLLNYILNQCELIVVITTNQSEAFQFFDSQNARGKSLYPHDLLKAFHLREMTDLDADKTAKIVADWEKVPQTDLNEFFGDYLYRLKEWINGNFAQELNEQNIYKFKGINKHSRTPYAQFFKSAFSYAQMVNNSAMPFVTGTREVTAFQLSAPIIAGEPFFNFTQYYLELLHDIRNNNKDEGFYIQDNEIVKTLDNYFKWGKGNRIARLLFDTALLLYVDRFCPPTFPSKLDTELFDQFTIFAFIWAYSLRAQHASLGWLSAQNFILNQKKDKINSFNIYRLIIDSDSPNSLLSTLADRLYTIPDSKILHARARKKDEIKDNIHSNYLYYFKINNFYKA